MYPFHMQSMLRLISFLVLAAALWAQPANEEIRKILIDRIDTQKQGVGMVIGIIDANGRRIVAHGALAKNDQRR